MPCFEEFIGVLLSNNMYFIAKNLVFLSSYLLGSQKSVITHSQNVEVKKHNNQ